MCAQYKAQKEKQLWYKSIGNINHNTDEKKAERIQLSVCLARKAIRPPMPVTRPV